MTMGAVLDYHYRDCMMRGYLARPEGDEARSRPAVLIFPDGFGLGEPAKRRAHMLADLGYVAFIADPYGDGALARDVAEGYALSGTLLADPDELRGRMAAAFDTIRGLPGVDAARIASIGYCFGGTCALELARTGTETAALISFHGGLATTRPASAGAIRPSVLVCTGSIDPLVPMEQVLAFTDEMTRAGADWQLAIYGGAPHNFTNPQAGLLGRPGVGYDENADHRSWQAMLNLFAETIDR
jgi:dienelactone hydrolase